jgi:hypothetical protein
VMMTIMVTMTIMVMMIIMVMMTIMVTMTIMVMLTIMVMMTMMVVGATYHQVAQLLQTLSKQGRSVVALGHRIRNDDFIEQGDRLLRGLVVECHEHVRSARSFRKQRCY